MNERIKELAKQAYIKDSLERNPKWKESEIYHCLINEMDSFLEKFAELMIMEFCDVVKSTANELNEHYFKQGASEEEVLMRVNGALVVLGHIRARFVD